ncbi:MAG: DUF3788 family protein [Candidatus Zixiibacteriota bacterium]
MAISIFDDKTMQPSDNDLAKALGRTLTLWNELQERISALFSPAIIEWGYAGKSTGWGMRIKKEKRVIVYMTPCNDHFLASFALGEKAVKAAHESGLPAPILEIIDDAPRYAEGRGVRIQVRTTTDVRNIERLAVIKLAN